MKWFRHETDAFHSEKMRLLKSKYGLEGIGRYWTIFELVAERMDETDKCSLELPWPDWCSFLSGKRLVLLRFFLDLASIFGFKVESNELVLKIEIRKLLEKRDNHSKYGKVSGKKTSLEVEVEVEVEVDKNTHTENAVCVLVDFFRNEFAKIHGVKPPPDQANKIYAGLVPHFSLDDLKRATLAFLECRDPPLFDAGYPIAWLPHRLPGLLAKKPKEEPVLPLEKVFVQPPSGNEAAVWAAALERIKGEILPDNFSALIEPIRPAFINGKSAVLVVPTRYLAAQVSKHYHEYLVQVLGKKIQLVAEEQVDQTF